MTMNTQESTELSDNELAHIELLIREASEGPWLSYVAGRDGEPGFSCIELGSCNELGSFDCIELVGCSAADQDFIASAREYLPRLLREVRALRARLDSLQSFASRVDGAKSLLTTSM
jgi:hypothetical protein